MTERQKYFATKAPSDFKAMFTMPENYDPRDRDTIRIFGERLRELIETTDQRNQENEAYYSYNEERATWQQLPIGKLKQCQVRTAKQLAQELGISNVAVSQYINGKIACIPEQHFFALYRIFGATPHYLTGYVDGICERLELDDDRNPIYKNGRLSVTVDDFTHGMYLEEYAYYLFQSVLYSSFKEFAIFSDFLTADKEVQNGGFAILRAYMDSHKAVAKSIEKDSEKNKGKDTDKPK